MIASTIKSAAVGISYTLFAVPVGDHDSHEEKQAQAMGVFKILQGKLFQSDLVRLPSSIS